MCDWSQFNRLYCVQNSSQLIFFCDFFSTIEMKTNSMIEAQTSDMIACRFLGECPSLPKALAVGRYIQLGGRLPSRTRHSSSYCKSICSGSEPPLSYGVVPNGLLTCPGFLGNAEFSPWKRLREFVELRKCGCFCDSQ